MGVKITDTEDVSLGDPWVRLTRAHAAQGGVTLEPEQG